MKNDEKRCTEKLSVRNYVDRRTVTTLKSRETVPGLVLQYVIGARETYVRMNCGSLRVAHGGVGPNASCRCTPLVAACSSDAPIATT